MVSRYSTPRDKNTKTGSPGFHSKERFETQSLRTYVCSKESQKWFLWLVLRAPFPKRALGAKLVWILENVGVPSIQGTFTSVLQHR
jgi:hypothetical protein